MNITLRTFSDSLAELYERAEDSPPDRFPDVVLRLIRRMIDFDGAMLGSCDKTPPGLHLERVTIFNRNKALAKEYGDVSGLDPIAAAFIKGLQEPLAVDCEKLYAELGVPQLSDFASKHAIRKLLIYGEALSPGHSAYGIALYRSEGPDFSAMDVRMLHATWHHVMQAIALNMKRALQHIDPHGTTRALALINSRGMVEIANAAMIALLKLEWPKSKALSLPASVVKCLIDDGIYRGKYVEISASEKFGYMACIARRTPIVDALSPVERVVADHFAKGMTHTQIATQLRVSPHTVRNQLAQVYQKLDVHSKAQLVRTLSSRALR